MTAVFFDISLDWGESGASSVICSMSDKACAVEEKHENKKNKPETVILLCTYQGQRFLKEQLESYINQTYTNWCVWASDDSYDAETKKILNQFQMRYGYDRISIMSGPKKNHTTNFLSLACNPKLNADFYAFSDQDDYWKPNKLERAIKFLNSVPAKIPALYCARTELISEAGAHLGLSLSLTKSISFENSLVQCVAGGNTMVFNEAARLLVLKAANRIFQVPSHDWWMYMLVTGCGGKVFYDSEPTVGYRQHEGNLVGANITWQARFKRIILLWQGRFRDWNDINISNLRSVSHMLTPKNIEILEIFAKAREMALISRLINLKRSGIYRQTLLGNIGLIIGAIFNKL